MQTHRAQCDDSVHRPATLLSDSVVQLTLRVGHLHIPCAFRAPVEASPRITDQAFSTSGVLLLHQSYTRHDDQDRVSAATPVGGRNAVHVVPCCSFAAACTVRVSGGAGLRGGDGQCIKQWTEPIKTAHGPIECLHSAPPTQIHRLYQPIHTYTAISTTPCHVPLRRQAQQRSVHRGRREGRSVSVDVACCRCLAGPSVCIALSSCSSYRTPNTVKLSATRSSRPPQRRPRRQTKTLPGTRMPI